MNFILPTIFSFLVLFSFRVQAQDPLNVKQLSAYFSQRYGPDQTLVSGVRYYNLYTRFKGHRYFGEDRYVDGTLYLDRGEFKDLALKYDLYGQQVILKVILGDGNFFEVIVTDSRLKGFDLEEKHFRKVYYPLTDTMIVQVVGSAEPYCYFRWNKEVILNRTDLKDVDEFSDMKRKTYLVRNESILQYKGIRSFSKAFPGHRNEIKAYLRQNKIRLKKAGDREMEDVLQFCRALMNEEGEM